ncbi:hypothetical protein C2U70_00670 [Bradyrhizobium guangdongense]|uniref:hypothetical protein n=1 Tax=Bradyrhizobium guangdongense TaxID=1325090 RepID=UPI00112DFDC7|nr:hypothetical protein [Bradyrhizobium guangdongense]TPQ42807.1 hypothetical protein C2U70_00670 [Bradyrhizobium guangdongense]
MSSVIASRSTALAVGLVAGFVLLPVHAHAQWWKRAPVDFEDCADRAEKSATKAETTAALAECNAKYAGRRKPGGGYTYYDFLQDRTFDIAGPNPTPEEQKKIDESYTSYLGNQRRSHLAAEAAAKQQQQQEQIQQVALRSTETERVPVPVERPRQQQLQQQPAASTDVRPRPKNCAKGSFSCEWPRLSEGLNDLKKLFTTPSGKKKS